MQQTRSKGDGGPLRRLATRDCAIVIQMQRSPQYVMVQRKICVLGFRATGKTALTTRFCDDVFLERHEATIEGTYRKLIRFKKIHVSTDIIDTAGMDEYSRPSRNALVGVHGYLLVYSVASKVSFDKIKLINDQLLNMLGDTPDVPRVLVGSMMDLTEQRQVSYEEGQSLAESWGVPFLETSSRRSINVAEAFHALVKEVEKTDCLLTPDSQRLCVML